MRQRGMVTAEVACALLAVVVLIGAGAWAASVLVQQVTTNDLAAQAARQAGRGDTAAVKALQDAVPGARVGLERRDSVVVATVSVRGRAWGRLPAMATTARATAVLEPGR